MILNDFFSRRTDILFKHDGTLDKYIGDGLMAVFGAPMAKEDNAERAIRAAQKMMEALPHRSLFLFLPNKAGYVFFQQTVLFAQGLELHLCLYRFAIRFFQP